MLRLSILLSALVAAGAPVLALDTVPPLSAVVSPANGAFLNTLPSITGTAVDDVAVSSVQLQVVRQSDSYFWDGSAFTAAEGWLAVSFADPNWSYSVLPAWVSGGSYTVIARAEDTSGNLSAVYSTSVFHFDTGLPVSAVTVPAGGSSTPTFSGVAGTAWDADSSVGQVLVKFQRLEDNKYWDSGSSLWTASETWNLAVGSATWAWSGPAQAALTSGATYFAVARAEDLAGNIQVSEIAGSTFIYTGAPLPPGCDSAVTVKSGGGGDFFFIQDALDALPRNLTGNTCVVATPDGSYTEEVVVHDFNTNGYRLKIMAEPGSGAIEVSAPPGSTAAFRLYNASVTLAGIDLVFGGPTPYGVLASSENIILSSVTVASAGSISVAGVYITSSSVISDSHIVTEFSAGILVKGGGNILARDTVTNNSVNGALSLDGASYNTVIGGSYYNDGGSAVEMFNGAGYNSVISSTMTSYGNPAAALYLSGASYNTVMDSYMQGVSSAAYVAGSTGTVIGGSRLSAAEDGGIGLAVVSGSHDLSLASSTIAGGIQGAAVYLGADNSGSLNISSNVISGGAYGLDIAAQSAGAALNISSLTFQSLAFGGTAVNFTGGAPVSTFTGFAFNDANMGANVDASLLSAEARITLRNYSGARAGAAYENDPSGYVDWYGSDITAPSAAVLQPVNFSYLNLLAEIAGTAADNVSVSSVTLAVRRGDTGLYWDGAAWSAGQAWLNAAIWPSSWTYTNVPAWVDGSSYAVTARALDTSGNWSVAYSTALFTYDIAAPTVFINAPVTGTYASFSSLSGTAADPAGVAQVQVSVLREGDGLYWDGAAWAAGPVWNASAGTAVWNYNGITEAALASGATYMFNVRAQDTAGNLSNAAAVVSTFTYVLPPDGVLTPGAFSGIGVSSLTVNWNTTHSTETVYYVRLSSWEAEAPFLFSGSTTTTFLDFSGLTPDTGYYGFISTLPASGFIGGGSGITLAALPSSVDFSYVSYTSATLSWNGGANPDWTVYEAELSTSSAFDVLTSSSSGAAAGAVFTGLAQWTTYYGRVRAVNGGGLKTGYAGAASSALTLAYLPSGLVSGLGGSAQGASSITWTWNSGAVSDADMFAFYSGASVFLGTVPFGASGSYIETGLTPNAPRLLRVAGRNALGEGPLAASATIYTLAAAPASAAFFGVGYSSVSFNWPAGLNPAGTSYEYQLSESGLFGVLTSSGSGAATSVVFTGLTQGDTYYARVRAVNYDGVPTAYVLPAAPAVTQELLPSGKVSGLAGSALGVSSISWAWNSGAVAAADYFAFYSGSGVSLGTVTFTASASYAQTGLGPNSPQRLLAGGRNQFGDGPLAASATVYTLAQIPSVPSAAQVALSSADTALGLNGNPAGTVLQLWRSGDNISFVSLHEGTELSYSDGGLAECSAYYYKARARNGAGIYTAFSGVLAFSTLASTPEAPGGLYAEAQEGARIKLVWEPSPSSSVSVYSVYYDSATGSVDYSAPLAVLPANVTSWTTSALASGSSYKFAVRAGGACGAEEKNTAMLASAQAASSLSGVRAAIKVPQTGKRIKGNMVTVVAEIILGLPSQVAKVNFQYSPAGTGAWMDIPSASVNQPNPDLTAPYFVHLDADALAGGTYDLRAVATDIYGAADPAAPSVTVVTGAADYDINETVIAGEQSKEQKINNAVSSTVQAADDVTALITKVVIPSGAVTDSTASVTLVNNPASVPAPPSGSDTLSLAVKVNLSNGQTQLAAGRTAALSFTYKDDDGNGIVDGTQAAVDRLRVYSVSDSGGAWTPLATSVDKEKKTITAATTHFSFFSVFAAAVSGLGEVKVYPVPWQPGSGGRFDSVQGVTFSGVPAASRIKIYTLLGELVRLLEVSAADSGFKVWDGRNSEGHKAASGVYLAVVKSGSDQRTLKVAVER